ncbi:MAG TPA: hypothetical protein VKB46_12000 [Pyrinomonadaceae bacterium]|nr:hypothetical protein [Pyrinomonadaceae bacterium]
MSAIGDYFVLSRSAYAKCLALAQGVHSETTGKWLFKKTQVVGIDEFHREWQESVLEEVGFSYSGYVIGNYLDAQDVLNRSGFDEETEEARTLCKVFTAAFPFHEQVTFPELAPDKLLDFCREEFGVDDGPQLAEAVKAAHQFFKEGLEKVTPENLVVFTIR